MIPVNEIGKYGVVGDSHTYLTPLSAWTSADNVRFVGEAVFSTLSQVDRTSIYNPGIAVYGVKHIPGYDSTYGGILRHWAFAGTAAVKAWQGISSATITRASGAYSGGDWNFAIFNNLLFLNNGLDNPQVWSPVNLSTLLVDLPNWPANTRAAVLRPFKNYLVALDVTKNWATSKDNYPRMVKWSHSADVSYPSSWDHTDPTKDAGEAQLAEGTERLIDCLPLGDVNVIYTESSVWAQSLASSGDVFTFHPMLREIGVLGQECMISLFGEHFVVGDGDIVVHNLGGARSVVDNRVRGRFFSEIDVTTYHYTRVMHFRDINEIWIFYPKPVSGTMNNLNRVLIWDYRSDTWTFKDVSECRGLTIAPADLDGVAKSIPKDRIITGNVASPYITAIGPQYGASTTTTQRLTKYDIAAMEVGGRVIIDPHHKKEFRGIWPSFFSVSGSATLTIDLYVKADFGSNWTYVSSGVYTPGSGEKVDLYATGAMFALVFTMNSNSTWIFQEYSLDIVPLGAR